MCRFLGRAGLFVKNRRVCKKCYADIQAEYRAKADKKDVATYHKEYRQINSIVLKNNKRQHYETNKNSILEQHKLYYQNNSSTIKIRNTEYRLAHKIERNSREKQRRNTDPDYKLRTYLSRDIFRSVRSKNGLSTLDILPYSIVELRAHLEKQFEPWMNWNNHGRYNPKIWDDNNQTTWTWQIDHIVPRSQFNYSTIDDLNFAKCWALDNLRPLSSKTNLINGSKLPKRRQI